MLTDIRGRRVHGGGRRAVVATVAAVITIFALAGVGTAILMVGTSAPATSASGQTPPGEPNPLHDGLPRSSPVRLRIPAIGVDSALVSLGLQDDRTTMELPSSARQIGWYNGSPTPGEKGTSIIAGFIKDGKQPGVLADLADLTTGQDIIVSREDGTIAVFTVDRIQQFPHGTFPANEVYAASAVPVLRIVTVGGVMRPGDQPGNVVVYAHMTVVRHDAPAPGE